ncbi:MAG: hypothetical protein IT186_07560 [Acidobacteria bacterium]|nr:hypothetical protein [Acidobacteriota bacterium]MCG3193810.1 hypothetical protein [Thermoanaerobaculia bacterium]
MKNITIDLRDVDNIDIQGRGRVLGGSPPRRKLGLVEKKALGAAMDLWKVFYPQASLFRDPMIISDTPPSLTIKKPSKVPVGMTPRTKEEATLALGMTTTAFAVVGVSVSGGVYGSTNGELGVYTGGSVGLWTNVGVSMGPQYTFIFGPPSDFAGVSWGVGCDIGVGIVGVGGDAPLHAAAVPVPRVLGQPRARADLAPV